MHLGETGDLSVKRAAESEQLEDCVVQRGQDPKREGWLERPRTSATRTGPVVSHSGHRYRPIFLLVLQERGRARPAC